MIIYYVVRSGARRTTLHYFDKCDYERNARKEDRSRDDQEDFEADFWSEGYRE